jgi:hypothetical protein
MRIGVVLDALQALPRLAQRELALILIGPAVAPGRAQLLSQQDEAVDAVDRAGRA